VSAELTLGPAWAQRPKVAVTRWRTARWRPGTVRPGLRILFYHRVSEDPDVLAVTPRRFAAQMQWLRARGLRVVDAGEAARLLAAGEGREGVVGLCFDDGYRDVAVNAVPVLERLGFAASVFVVSGVAAGHARLSWYAEQPPMLTWRELRALDRGSPLRCEAHTVTHPNLLALGDRAAEAEIAGSRAALEVALERRVEGFCYPAGLYGPRDRALVADAGFAWATSCAPGANLPGADRFALARIPVDAGDRLEDFRAKVEGAFDTSPAVREAYRRVRFAPRRVARASR
jgi:peptidoglycan/xylan/chitin deacetylase (PgdA/CDA1 family)